MVLPHRQYFALKVVASWREGLLSVSSIVPALGCARESSARRLLQPLEEKGLIERQALGPGLPKVIYLTRAGRELLGLVEEPPLVQVIKPTPKHSMPCVPVSCGPLSEAATECDYAAHPHTDWREGDYYAYSQGDSMWDKMRGVGIPPGVKTRMRPDIWPTDGDIIHLILTHSDGVSEETMKIFSQDARTGTVTLQAINPRYPDIVLSTEEFEDETRVEIKGIALDTTIPIRNIPRRDRK